MNFKSLHDRQSPLLICNVWDTMSAKIAESLHFPAIGTSSGAIASMLGYNDGEEMSFEELIYIVSRIVTSVKTPLTVDIEAGYSRKAEKIAKNILSLAKLGVIGVNLEDSIMVDGQRTLQDATIFSELLNEVTSILADQAQNIFINVRTDTFLLDIPNKLPETINRAKQYQNTGAHGIFVPCIEYEDDIKAVVKGTALPVNVMCMANLPKFDILASLGVKRISMGNFVFNKSSEMLEMVLKSIQESESFQNLFN